MESFNRFGNMFPPPEKIKRPYLLWREPFCITDNLFFVGNEWCSSHLIDTGEGLILLDTPCASALPGLIYSIYRLGFRLEELKYILISHAHTDHFGAVGALVHMTGAKTFLGAVDAQDMREHPERLEEMNQSIGPYEECFQPDVELKDGDVVELGNTRIHCVLTPGHTVGVMSHFWTLQHEKEILHVGIYGGAGFVSLSKEALKKNRQPLSLREDFQTSIQKVWDEPVDVMLGNHPFHNDTYRKYERLVKGDPNPFIDATEWHRFLQELTNQYQVFLPKTTKQLQTEDCGSQWENYYSFTEDVTRR